MTLTDDLLRQSYPAVIVERWAGTDGWPCFRVFLAVPGHTIPIAGEYATLAAARAEAVEVAATQPAPCRIIDMTGDD
jgi:hypothetical protein